MTRGRRANERLDVLIDKLGLHEQEYYKDVEYWGELEKGILQDFEKRFQKQINAINEQQSALLDYLGVTAETQTVSKAKVIIKPIKARASKAASKRKYVKSGKYSKKTNNV